MLKSTSHVSYPKRKREREEDRKKEKERNPSNCCEGEDLEDSRGKSRATHCRLQQDVGGAWPHLVPALLTIFLFHQHAALIPATGHLHEMERSRADSGHLVSSTANKFTEKMM